MFSKLMERSKYYPRSQKRWQTNNKNYWPVSLLPICSNFFEKNIFHSLCKYLKDYKLLTCNQSGFCHSDSCMHQLLSMTHAVYKLFGANPSLEIRGAFRTKAFYRVWNYNFSEWSVIEMIPSWSRCFPKAWILAHLSPMITKMTRHKDCAVIQNYLRTTLDFSQQSLAL